MIPLTDEETKSYEEQNVCHICKKEFYYDENKEKEIKLYQKSKIIVITLKNLEELLIVFAN